MVLRVHRTQRRGTERVPLRAAEGTPPQHLQELSSNQHMPMSKLPMVMAKTAPKDQRGQSMSIEFTWRWL